MRPTVHNLKIEPMQTNDVYIGRARQGLNGYFGNPYQIGPDGLRGDVIVKFRAYAEHRIATDPVYRRNILALADKRLFCYCRPHPCHGDILAELSIKLQHEHDLDVALRQELTEEIAAELYTLHHDLVTS